MELSGQIVSLIINENCLDYDESWCRESKELTHFFFVKENYKVVDINIQI